MRRLSTWRGALAAIFLGSLSFSSPGPAQVSFGVNRILQVSGVGTPAENCQGLMDTLASITDASDETPYLVRLEPADYHCGAVSLYVPAWVTLEGSGRELTRIIGTIDDASLGVVHLTSHTTLRSLAVINSWTTPTYDSIAVSVFDFGQPAQSVFLDAVGLSTGAFLEGGAALKTINSSVVCFHLRSFGSISLNGGHASFHFSWMRQVDMFPGTGTKTCYYSARYRQELDFDCNPKP